MTRINLFYICFLLIFLFISCKTTDLVNEKIPRNAEGFIIVNPDNISPFNNGIFEGWGTSLCWWANRIGGDEKLSNDIIDLFFSEKGLKLNIIRYNIGGGDDPTHNHITRSDSAMPGFLVYDENTKSYVYDWNADLRQRNILKKINKLDKEDIIIEFFSNSPPYFMTNSGCTSGNKPANFTNLNKNYYEEFAKYLAEVTYNLQILDGVKVTSLEPMNEPNSVSWKAFSSKQEGCHISRGSKQSKLINETRKALDKKGLNDIIISGCDESGVGIQASSFNALNKEAKNNVKRINSHTYWGEKYKQLYNSANKNNKNLWISETDYPELKGENNGEMGPALAFAYKIIHDLNNSKASAWVLWQIIDSYLDNEPFNGIVCGNNLPNLNNSYWGTAYADFNNNKIILTKKYYAYAHFSKFIKPGSKLIYLNSDKYLASYNDKDEELVIVGLNTGNEDIVEKFDLSNFIIENQNINIYRTSGLTIENTENCTLINDKINIENNDLSLNLKSNSITTVVLDNIKRK